MALNWPSETVSGENKNEQWCQFGSNCVLDFHGDPQTAELIVFSDGNHHMALLQCLKAFCRRQPKLSDIFYVTTPPAPIVKLLKAGTIQLGNLTLRTRPHVFFSPPDILENLKADGHLNEHHFLAQNRGSVLLIPLGNPKTIVSLTDLMRKDVRLFISNPETERVSYAGYRQTLEGVAKKDGLDVNGFCEAAFDDTVVLGQRIHHREAPEAVASGRADVAIVYYHLARRYTRIFPDQFDFIPLGGTKIDPNPPPENLIAKIHMGLIDDGGPWGKRFVDFMQSEEASQIYSYHGLRHKRDIPIGF